MAKTIRLNPSIIKKIDLFIELLKKQKISVKKTILFGSYAKGAAQSDSDIDIAVVSPQFGHDNFSELMLLRKTALKVDFHIEPIPFTPQDLKNPYSTLSQEINKFGIVLK